MGTQTQLATSIFQILDAPPAPHGGLILRLRHREGPTPRLRELRGARLRLRSPEGEERLVRVTGFALTGGKPSDDRLARTGRVDLHVVDEGNPEEGEPVTLRWVAEGPLRG